MKKLITLIVFLILLLASCATYSFVPMANQSIKLSHDRGTITPIYVDNRLGVVA